MVFGGGGGGWGGSALEGPRVVLRMGSPRASLRVGLRRGPPGGGLGCEGLPAGLSGGGSPGAGLRRVSGGSPDKGLRRGSLGGGDVKSMRLCVFYKFSAISLRRKAFWSDICEVEFLSKKERPVRLFLVAPGGHPTMEI